MYQAGCDESWTVCVGCRWPAGARVVSRCVGSLLVTLRTRPGSVLIEQTQGRVSFSYEDGVTNESHYIGNILVRVVRARDHIGRPAPTGVWRDAPRRRGRRSAVVCFPVYEPRIETVARLHYAFRTSIDPPASRKSRRSTMERIFVMSIDSVEHMCYSLRRRIALIPSDVLPLIEHRSFKEIRI